MFLVPALFGQQAIRRKVLEEAEIQARQSVVRDLESRLGKTEKPSTTGAAITSEQNREIYAASELLARKPFSLDANSSMRSSAAPAPGSPGSPALP
jgi:hypothetical protein